MTGVLSPEEVNTRLDFTPQLSKLQVSTGLCSVPQRATACRVQDGSTQVPQVLAHGERPACCRKLVIIPVIKLLCCDLP